MSCCDPKIDELLMQPSEVKLIVAVIMVDSDGRILIAKRPEGKLMSGLWEFPGGKALKQETPEAALVREIKEELGAKTCAGCLLPFAFASHRYEDFHLLMPVYICRKWEGIITGSEGQEIKWIKPSEIKNYPMPDANKQLMAALRSLL